MLVFMYLLLGVESVLGQKQGGYQGGNRYAPIPYYNLGPKPGNGVGVLQDLSNARILSNEPFIISFEFPKLVGSGDSRKNRFSGKSSRSKSQRKKNRKPRQFRHTMLPEKEWFGRRKRLPTMRRPPPLLENLRAPKLQKDDLDYMKTKALTSPFVEVPNPLERTKYARLVNLEAKEDNQTAGEMKEKEKEQPVQEVNSLRDTSKAGGEETESLYKQSWENIKKKWDSLFVRPKEGNNNEVDENEERIKAMNRKMWANCQLLKLLKAPQRNPHFYKLLPPNYPALIMDEEKQLQCNQFYDITDLAKDKKMIEEKIEELERILSPGIDSGARRKREAPEEEEARAEEENTLQDETLQGKLEGEVRSDRSKRTRERQHIRRQRSKEPPKEKSRRVKRPAKNGVKESRRSQSERQEVTESDSAKRARRKDRVHELPTKKMLEDNDVKLEEDTAEQKREKQEIRAGKDNSLQDVFNPSEVNKVIRQKEMEANIFDKVLRAMRKYEDNNPYDESFRPHKRESGNSTENAAPVKADTSEEGWELEDTIKKLAKIFKVLGVKAEAAKKRACTDCNEFGESSSEESGEDGGKLKRLGKSPKCTCADCPFCQNCLQCFKECKKAAQAAKNSLSTGQSPHVSSSLMTSKGSNSDKDGATERDGRGREAVSPHEEQIAGERANNAKLERMYRSKLPPSRDLVRVYFDNPENKLLVWTKRGRRTMPWGPLTSDLQLYRDRARQILKSAEDILQRIRETEEKIHTEQYEENEHGGSDKTEKMNTMDDIIKKVVNEDDTKNVLRTPWETELEKGVIEGKVQSSHISKDPHDARTDNIFRDTVQEETELPKDSLTLEEVKENEGGNKPANVEEEEESFEVGKVEAATEPKKDNRYRATETEEVEETHEDGNMRRDVDGESVEAAVLPIDKEEKETSLKIDLNDYNEKNAEQVEDVEGKKDERGEREQEEEEDIPAKVEPISQDKARGEPAWKIRSRAKADLLAQRRIQKKLGKLQHGESGESSDDDDHVANGYLKRAHSDESQNVEKAYGEKSESVEAEEGSNEGRQKEDDENEDVKSPKSGESEEAGRTFRGESEKVEKVNGDDTEVEEKHDGKLVVAKTQRSRHSEEAEGTAGGESGEVRKANEQESDEVAENFSGKSGEAREAHSVEFEEEERASGGESGAVGKSQSGESEEMEEAYNYESESVEKARDRSSESQDVEKSAEKEIGELKNEMKEDESTTSPSMSADTVMKEPKKAPEKVEKLLMDKRQEESAEAAKSTYEKDESGEDTSFYEDDDQVERKESNVEEEFTEAAEDADEEVQRKSPTTEMKKPHPEAEDTVEKYREDIENKPGDDHSKSIEESYIIKDVKQTKEEKEAILEALLNVKKMEEKKQETVDEILQEMGAEEDVSAGKGSLEEVSKPEAPVNEEEDSLKAVVQHLEKGHMDENDFEAIKKLDDSQINLLVGEMHKNDEKGVSVNCETRMKLCRAVCNCSNNGTDSDLSKYEIIKGFLGWLKDLNMNKMAPISV